MNRIHRKRMNQMRVFRNVGDGIESLIGVIACLVGVYLVFTAGNLFTVFFGIFLFFCVGLSMIITCRDYRNTPGLPPSARRATIQILPREQICQFCDGWGRKDRPVYMRLWFSPKECEMCGGQGYLGEIDNETFDKIWRRRFNRDGV